MVTTLMNNPTSERLVSHVSNMSFPMSSRPSVVSHAAATATAVIAPTNRWLGGIDGLGCGSDQNAYGIKRTHPGRLGGVT